MTNIIETMARALCKARGEDPHGMHWAFVDGDWRGVSFEKIAEHDAAAAITALTKAGYVIVPREPDDAMICAGIIERHDQSTPEAWSLATANIYRAMINAAQGIEAATADETRSGSAVGESPVSAGNAPHIMPPIRDSGPLESEEGE